MLPVPKKPKSRRGGRGYDDKHAQETEQKRKTGERSCAECRRLKIRCDKQIPCWSCQRRGCVTLCPNGSLPTGEGTRSIVAATEHLHRRLADKNERIRQLEDALRKCHAMHSTEPHPLLRPGVLEASQGEKLKPLGTPSISGSGASRFSGPTGGSHCLSMVDNVPFQDFADRPSDITRDFESSGLLREISKFIPAFLSEPSHSPLNVETLIKDRLPTWERASYLTKTYLEQALPLFQSVSMDQISSELLPAYYANGVPHVTLLENPHQAGLLFLIFAIAISLDLIQGPGNAEAEAELYHEVVRATVCFPSVITKPSLETIQVLHLLSVYNTVSGNELTGKQMSVETSWALVELATQVAHKLELDRNNDRCDLPAAITARQKMVYRELFVAYVWNSLEARILPSLSPSYSICGFLGKRGLIDNAHICFDKQDLRGSWAFGFVYFCVADVAARTLASEPPSYHDILELDRKVREFPVIEAGKEFATAASGAVPAKAADRDIGSMESMYRFVTSNTREILLLYIHWYFFGRVNWVDSWNTPSFSVMYEASLTILRTVKVQYGLHPKLTAEFGFVWTPAFLAVTVLGMIVMHWPQSPIASTAMQELRDARNLFSAASSHSWRAQKDLPLVIRRTEEAQNALLHAQTNIPDEMGQQWRVDGYEGGGGLAISVGQMKTVFMETDGMPSGPVPVSQHKQNEVEPLVRPPYSDEELRFTYHQPSGPAASLEQMREAPIPDWTTHPDTLSQSAAAPPTIPLRSTEAPVETVFLPSCSGEELGSTPLVQQSTFATSPGETQEMSTRNQALHPGTSSQSIAPLRTDTPHVPMQVPVEPVVQPSYYGEQLGSSYLQQPSSAAGPVQHWMLYSGAPSDSLAQSLASLEGPPRLPSEVSAQDELVAGSSTSAWLPEPSGPYPMADGSAPSEQAHPQGFHTPHDRHDIRFDVNRERHRQSWPQRHPSAQMYPYSPSHLRYPKQPPPCQRQPTHSSPPQSQNVLLTPHELAQLGLVARECELDQHGVSFIHESGFSTGNGYKG